MTKQSSFGTFRQARAGQLFMVTGETKKQSALRLVCGRRPVVVTDGFMCNWNLRNGSKYVTAVAFNPKNPGQLASASWDNTVKIWKLEDGQCQQTLQGHS